MLKEIMNMLRMLQWLILLIFTAYVSSGRVNKIEGYLLVITLVSLNNFDFKFKGE